MLRLKKVDDEFDLQVQTIATIIDDLNFQPQFIFELNDSIDYKVINSLNYKGVYLIEIETNPQLNYEEWLAKFKIEWEDPLYKRHFVPNIKLKRTKEHKELKEWFPLYIGKSKLISIRIKEHLDFKLTRNTTALKLRERTNLYGNRFRISTIEVDVKNYDQILPQIETVLRNRLNPIVGRQ